MSKAKVALAGATVVAALLALGGCNAASVEDLRRVEGDLQRVENEVTALRARVEASEARTDTSALSADSALDAASQCNQVCQQVSNRLDELYLETTPR